MVGYIVECDQCKRIQKLTETHGKIPLGWIVLSGGEDNDDKHFCSKECVNKYEFPF